MKTELELNIEHANEEIWRRQKLFMAAVFGFLPYGLLVIIPINEFIYDNIEFPLVVIYFITVIRVFIWSSKCPCPICGCVYEWKLDLSIFTESRPEGCTECGFKRSMPSPPDYSLSLKEIKYSTGTQANQMLKRTE